MEIILFWALFGLIGIAIGKSKGYDTATAFLAGMLLGPFSLLMIFVSKGSGGKKQCPQCAEWVQSAARVCRFCQHKFDESALQQSKYRECPHCRGLLTGGDSLFGSRDVCPHCKKAVVS